MLFDHDRGAADVLAAEGNFFFGDELDDTITRSVDGEVATEHGADASPLGLTNLADNDLTGLDSLAAEQLDAQALADAVAGVFTGTACFNV